MRAALPAAIAALLALAACGGDEEKAFTKLEGIYGISSWTRNDAGCAAEGPAVLDDMAEKYLWVKVGSFGPVKFLGLVPCVDLPTCRADAAGEVPLFGGWVFGDGDDRAGWTGWVAYAFTGPTPGTCSGGTVDYRLTSPAEGQLSLRSETRTAPTFPETGGECDPDAARTAAAPRPCEALEVIGAGFAEALP